MYTHIPEAQGLNFGQGPTILSLTSLKQPATNDSVWLPLIKARSDEVSAEYHRGSS